MARLRSEFAACSRRRARDGEPLFPHQRHRENASPSRPADLEAGPRSPTSKAATRSRRQPCRGSAPAPPPMRRMASACSSSNWQRSAHSRCQPGRHRSPRWIMWWSRWAIRERAAALYGARLGLDMALDRSHPDWGRLMFSRCGDLIVEVTHRPGKPADGGKLHPRQALAVYAGASPTSTPPMHG